MMKRILAVITDQQAPFPARQASAVENHKLSTNAHRIKGGITLYKAKRTTIVMMELKTPLNRFSFNQRIRRLTGGCITGSLRMAAIIFPQEALFCCTSS